MNCLDMSIQNIFLSKWLLANQTCEWLLIFMNCLDMSIQNTFMSKWLLANYTIKLFNIFMNCLHMYIEISILTERFVANQTSEWLLFSWTDLTWMLKDDFCPNDLLQTGQSKTCFSSVCSILCPCKQFFSAYVNLQYDEICVRMQPASSHHPASLTCSICWWELFNFQTNANLNQISEITICFDDRTITLCAVVGNTGWHGMAKSER